MQHNHLTAVLGLMAGTSVDGIDASLVFTDGERLERTGVQATFPMRPETRAAVFAAYEHPDPADGDLARLVAEDHAAAARNLLAQTDITPALIGFHGQTILHAPKDGVTIQIGDAGLLAALLGIEVMHDFRQMDVAAGGQGAPLAPIYHRAIIEELGLELPAAIVNIGGITNVTIWDGITLRGFDTGPGNALMDETIRRHTDQDFDKDGAIARQGRVDDAWINTALGHRFFRMPPPKSLDRAALSPMLEPASLKDHSLADAMATLTALTAESLALGLRLCPPGPRSVILAGGGAANPALVAMIRRAVPAAVTTMEEHGLNSGLIEAELMAFLAMRSRRGLPISFPETTGVATPLTGGRLAPVPVDAPAS